MRPTSTDERRRVRFAWSSAIVLFAALALCASAVRGRTARVLAPAMGASGEPRWTAVRDSAEAVRAWQVAGVHGRKLVVLTGRWGHPAGSWEPQDEETGATSPPTLPLDAETGIFAATRLGIARDLLVFMNPEAVRQRTAEITERKGLRAGTGWVEAPYRGYERTFAIPDAATAPEEPVLLLVEPSYFTEDVPPPEWLASRGFRFDLGLVALEDPAATPLQRELARMFAARVGATPAGGAR
ncbi:MAG TPA: hypothetical protein VFE30_02015 [Anaeromyxobacteraceae bacterium]|jgi:hypothetical protein|nr:hypothetical protein [Anaeromyxobacteraceae bacterium]